MGTTTTIHFNSSGNDEYKKTLAENDNLELVGDTLYYCEPMTPDSDIYSRLPVMNKNTFRRLMKEWMGIEITRKEDNQDGE